MRVTLRCDLRAPLASLCRAQPTGCSRSRSLFRSLLQFFRLTFVRQLVHFAMSSQGATLQNYNNELVSCLEDLRSKRELLNKTIVAEERKKADIQRKLEKLSAQLARVNESLSQKVAARNEYDVTISETEAAYMQILASSQTLLHVLKREATNLTKSKKSGATGLGSSQEMAQQQQQQQTTTAAYQSTMARK